LAIQANSVLQVHTANKQPFPLKTRGKQGENVLEMLHALLFEFRKDNAMESIGGQLIIITLMPKIGTGGGLTFLIKIN